jgi:hypothetical protein
MLRGVLYYQYENLVAGKLGPMIRQAGQRVFRQGMNMQEDLANEDRLVPSLRSVAISDRKYPKLLGSDWVAPNVTAIGDVNLGKGSSLWHGAVVRGDQAKVTIGKNVVV